MPGLPRSGDHAAFIAPMPQPGDNTRMIDATRYPAVEDRQPGRPAQAPESDLRAAADELRGYLIESVGKSGGAFRRRPRRGRG